MFFFCIKSFSIPENLINYHSATSGWKIDYLSKLKQRDKIPWRLNCTIFNCTIHLSCTHKYNDLCKQFSLFNLTRAIPFFFFFFFFFFLGWTTTRLQGASIIERWCSNGYFNAVYSRQSHLLIHARTPHRNSYSFRSVNY